MIREHHNYSGQNEASGFCAEKMRALLLKFGLPSIQPNRHEMAYLCKQNVSFPKQGFSFTMGTWNTCWEGHLNFWEALALLYIFADPEQWIFNATSKQASQNAKTTRNINANPWCLSLHWMFFENISKILWKIIQHISKCHQIWSKKRVETPSKTF